MLTANITDIDQNGLVTVMFNSNIENYMFNITEKKGYDFNYAFRWLTTVGIIDGFKNSSMNISDINSTFLEMYIIPSEDR